jgi:hypothetical protein
MKVSDLIVEVRNASLQRVGQLTQADLVGFTAVLRYNAVGGWKVTMPVGNPMAEALSEPGAGIIVSTSNGVLLSGPTTAVITNQATDDPDGTYEITGVDDSVLLTERLSYPKPSTADVTAQNVAYDVRTGACETVLKAYVDANIGPTAPTARKVTGLTVEASAGRGATVTGQGRFQTLQELLEGLADVAGLGFTIEQVGTELQFQVYQPVDRSAYVRLDLQNGRLKKSEYTYSQPLVTRTIVGGDGDDELRTFIERSNTTSVAAETTWKRRIEVFTDSRSTTDTAKLQQAGDEVLASDGKTQVSVSITPSDDQTMLFGTDWNLGDKVSVVVGDTELQSIVTEVGLLIAADGVRIGATVGEPRSLDYETQILTRQADAALRISKLERTK